MLTWTLFTLKLIRDWLNYILTQMKIKNDKMLLIELSMFFWYLN